MDETLRLAFVAAVTCFLLARVLGGPANSGETVVYGASAAVGLEFMIACWRDRWNAS